MLDRLAAAPISWGICEVPGWGVQLAPRRVLAEIRELGIRATELGALGWLPTDAVALRALLDEYGLRLTGGFVPLVLHEPAGRDAARAAAQAAAATLAAGGATCFVTGVVSSYARWERPELSSENWSAIFDGFDMVEEVCAAHGLVQVVHPHVDTLIETAGELDRFLNHSAAHLCLDTGHLFIGGADPVVIARKYHDRIGLVHLKDVDMGVAAGLYSDELSLMMATQVGLFPSAGTGDVPIGATIAALEDSLYTGWYVLEQDVALTDAEPPLGEGPVLGVKASIEYLRSLAA